ncbi:MAG: hypothetical protein IRZ15_06955 [Bryobacteraceae bacterium]|nr:hypothetical protein [Bryobacteraceae bacterium]
MTHPSDVDLALYAGGETGRLRRWQIQRHLSRCGRCREEVASFCAAREGLRRGGGRIPQGVNWSRLAAEMKANIRLGLDAGEIVAQPQAPPLRLGWRPAVALGALTLVIVSGWWLHLPSPVSKEEVAETGVVLGAADGAIELREGAFSLTLVHPGAENVTYLVDFEGSVRARYVDSESGQVTIQNLYAE